MRAMHRSSPSWIKSNAAYDAHSDAIHARATRWWPTWRPRCRPTGRSRWCWCCPSHERSSHFELTTQRAAMAAKSTCPLGGGKFNGPRGRSAASGTCQRETTGSNSHAS